MKSISTLLDLRHKDFPNLPPDQFSYKLAGGYALDIPVVGDLDIDESEMSMWLPAADGNRRDGVGDVVDVEGINTSRHVKNSIIGFDHFKNIHLPIARSRRDPKDISSYTFKIDVLAKTAGARIFFYQGQSNCGLTGSCKSGTHSQFCGEIFDMACQGFVGSGSIGYSVISGESLAPDYMSGLPQGLHLKKILLLEISLVVLPANMDTVGKTDKYLGALDYISKALTGGRILGKQPSEYFKKAFTPYLPTTKTQVVSGYSTKQLKVPNYREAEDPEQSCGTCEAFRPHGNQFGQCAMFNVGVEPTATCDRWVSAQTGRGEKSMNFHINHTKAYFRTGPLKGLRRIGGGSSEPGWVYEDRAFFDRDYNGDMVESLRKATEARDGTPLPYDVLDNAVDEAGLSKSNYEPPLPKEPTHHMPGTPEKEQILSERLARGEQLHHPRDPKHEKPQEPVQLHTASTEGLEGAEEGSYMGVDTRYKPARYDPALRKKPQSSSSQETSSPEVSSEAPTEKSIHGPECKCVKCQMKYGKKGHACGCKSCSEGKSCACGNTKEIAPTTGSNPSVAPTGTSSAGYASAVAPPTSPKSISIPGQKIIRHEGGKWILYSHEGKVLGRHDSEEDAKRQERAIEAHKHGKGIKAEPSGSNPSTGSKPSSLKPANPKRPQQAASAPQPAPSTQPAQAAQTAGESSDTEQPKIGRREWMSDVGKLTGGAAIGSVVTGLASRVANRQPSTPQQEAINIPETEPNKPLRRSRTEEIEDEPPPPRAPKTATRQSNPAFEGSEEAPPEPTPPEVAPQSPRREERRPTREEPRPQENVIQRRARDLGLYPSEVPKFDAMMDRLREKNPKYVEWIEDQDPRTQGRIFRTYATKWGPEGTRIRPRKNMDSPNTYAYNKKSLKDLRDKYRKADGRFHRSKHSTPGAIHMQLSTRDLDNLREDAEAKGVEARWISDDGRGNCKVKLSGMDNVLEELAKKYGKAAKKVKSLPPVNNPDRDKDAEPTNNPIGTIKQDPKTVQGKEGTASRERASLGNLPAKKKDTDLQNSQLGTEIDEGRPDNTPVLTARNKAMKKTVTIEHENEDPTREQEGNANPPGSKKKQGDGGAQGTLGEEVPGEDYSENSLEAEEDYHTKKGANEPYGMQVLRRIHADMAGLLHEYDEFLDQLEDESVRALTMRQIQHFIQSLEELEESAGTHERYKEKFLESPLEGVDDKKQLATKPTDSVGADSALGGKFDDLEEEDRLADQPTPDEALEGMQTSEVPPEEEDEMDDEFPVDQEGLKKLYHKRIKSLRHKHGKQYPHMDKEKERYAEHGHRSNNRKAYYLLQHYKNLGNASDPESKKLRKFLLKKLKEADETLLQGKDKENRPHTEEERHDGMKESATFKPGTKDKKSQPSDDISPEKARQMLKDGTAHGHKLTEKQRGMLGAAAGRDKKD